MRRVLCVATPVVAAAVFPASAFAVDGSDVFNPTYVGIAVSLLGLIVAVILLVEALNVRQLGAGGAIAEKMNYVVLAIICLAASALAQWARNFVDGVTAEQVQFASQVLVITAMGLLAAYFISVRRAFQQYMTSMTGGQLLRDEIKEREAAEEDSERG
jgi:hypothetical protein